MGHWRASVLTQKFADSISPQSCSTAVPVLGRAGDGGSGPQRPTARRRIRVKKRDNLPLDNKRFKDVIVEYLRLRKSQFERATYQQANKVNPHQTSEQNLRQMGNVSRGWLFDVAQGVRPIDRVPQ